MQPETYQQREGITWVQKLKLDVKEMVATDF